MKFLAFSQTKILGSSFSLPAHGWAGARATVLAAHFAKRNTKFGGGGKARAGKNSFPPTPFLFARPSENYQKSASGFSRKKVRILFRTDSQIGKFRFPASLGALPLASQTNFQAISKRANLFSPEGRKQSGNLSAEGGLPKSDIK